MTIKNGSTASAGETIEGYGNPMNSLIYQQITADSSSWTNENYAGGDILSSSGGVKSTIDSGTTTAFFNSPESYYQLGITDTASGDTTHDPDSMTNPENAFDGNDATYASKNQGDVSLGKTFGAKYITFVKVKCAQDFGVADSGTIKIETYNGSSWAEADSFVIQDDTDTTFYTADVAASVQGVRVSASATSSNTFYLYTLEYASEYNTPQIVESNTIIDEKVPKSIVVYAKTTLPAGTSITVDVSDDGGSTWDLTGKEVNAYIDTSSFSTGDLALKFNLATSDTQQTPILYGYSVVITDS